MSCFTAAAAPHLPAEAPVMPTKATLQQFVVRERQPGVRAVTVNTYIGAMNAFCVWLAL